MTADETAQNQNWAVVIKPYKVCQDLVGNSAVKKIIAPTVLSMTLKKPC
jgi:hypothetical protein